MNDSNDLIFGNCWLELALRWVLGITFIVASVHKIIDPATFAKILYGYKLFPPISINLLAIIVPFLELVCGMALISGIYSRSAALIVNAMLVLFIMAISINLIRGHAFDCGCFSFGKSGYSSSIHQLLIRDIIYLIFGLHIFLYSKKRKYSIF